LQQFADIGEFLLMLGCSGVRTDRRHVGDGLVQCFGQGFDEIGPLDPTNTSRRRWRECSEADRDGVCDRQQSVEIERGGFEIGTNPQHTPDTGDATKGAQDQNPVVLLDGLIERTLTLQDKDVGG